MADGGDDSHIVDNKQKGGIELPRKGVQWRSKSFEYKDEEKTKLELAEENKG